MSTVFEVIGMGAKKYGGFERYILEEAKQLNSKGNKLVIIFDTPPLAKEYVNDLLENNVSYYVIPYSNKWRFIKKNMGLISRYKPSVIHTNFSSNGFIIHLLALIKGIPNRIATEHCTAVLSSLKLKLLFLYLSAVVHNILSVSETGSNSLKQGLWFNQEKIKTLYLGVNDFHYNKFKMREKYNLPIDEVLLMNVAYHNPIKGVDVLLYAFAELLNNYHIKNITLCQIGGGQTGTDTEYLKNIAKKLKIEDHIIWMGLQDRVPEILSAGDIYCQPSRSEGIPLSIMEASLAQLPIIATKVGGNPEAAIENVNAILVSSEDFESMAKAICLFCKDPAKRYQYGYQGRIFALEKFSIKSQVNQMITEYYNL